MVGGSETKLEIHLQKIFTWAGLKYQALRVGLSLEGLKDTDRDNRDGELGRWRDPGQAKVAKRQVWLVLYCYFPFDLVATIGIL